jgi:hypothetical protein
MTMYLFLLSPFSLLLLQLLSGSLPVCGQLVDVGCQLLVGRCGLVQLLTEHGVHMGQTGGPDISVEFARYV